MACCVEKQPGKDIGQTHFEEGSFAEDLPLHLLKLNPGNEGNCKNQGAGASKTVTLSLTLSPFL